ncbi:MAG: NEAT domain-containing protein, partial [Turicibacter sp.]
MRKFLQIILAIAIVFTQIPLQVFATSSESEHLAYGVYEVKNFAKHESKDEDSMARKYLNETSQLDVNENGMFLTLSFTGKKMMAQHQITVNGESTAFEVMDETD